MSVGTLLVTSSTSLMVAAASFPRQSFRTGDINGGIMQLSRRGGMPVSRTVFVLNGPNLNLLGKRQPHIYGHETLADVERDCTTTAAELKLEIRFHQSNREYEIIDWIHEARENAGGIVINPAAFTHTSVAILDALNACEFPIFEVHISNVHKREAFRHHSYVSLRGRCHRGVGDAGLHSGAAASRAADRRQKA
jgi:3-dehydroquinate dehydratase II